MPEPNELTRLAATSLKIDLHTTGQARPADRRARRWRDPAANPSQPRMKREVALVPDADSRVLGSDERRDLCGIGSRIVVDRVEPDKAI